MTDEHSTSDPSADDSAPIDATVISSRTSIGPIRPTSMVEVGRALEGRSLGPYQLLQFVGGGGMGAVFRALDSTLDRIVAVKVLSRQQSSDEEMLKRFRNEAQSAARLDHENIGRVHAVGSDDGWHYIVFEYIEGTNLRDIVNEAGPFDLARVIDVSVQLADALEHASQRDVVHRDIKPSNIIITPTGRARIVDMGLARLHQVAGDQDLTASGMTLGTFDYISPEQARDPRSADVRSDLYSLGCTIFFMLAGRPPFAEGTMVQKLLQHQQDAPPAIESLRPDVPRRFGEILGRLMEKDPADRYQRPADLIADLVAFADAAGVELSAPRPAVAPLPEPRGRRLVDHLPWLLPVLGLGVVVGGLWLRSRALPTDAADRSVAVDATAEAEAASAEPRGNGWRVVDEPLEATDRSTLAEAVQAAADGDVIELAYTGFHDEMPLVVQGKRLVVRAAEGFKPAIRFVDRMPIGQPDGDDATPQWQAACLIEGGSLRLESVAAEASLTPAEPGSLWALRGDAMIECVDVRMELVPDFSQAVADEESLGTRQEDAFIGILPPDPYATPPRDEGRQEVRVIRSTVTGDAAFCHAGGGAVTIVWSASSLVDAARFLVADGVARGGREPRVRLALDTSTFDCREGFASLRDSPSRPVLPTLQAFADSCRFRIPDGRALLEQTGVADPEVYRDAVEWLDGGSRYEGSSIFRRIDGAAERVEMDYASSPQPLVHVPDGADWQDEAN